MVSTAVQGEVPVHTRGELAYCDANERAILASRNAKSLRPLLGSEYSRFVFIWHIMQLHTPCFMFTWYIFCEGEIQHAE